MTKRKRLESLCDILQRLTRVNKHDTWVEGGVEVKDGKQFLEKLL